MELSNEKILLGRLSEIVSFAESLPLDTITKRNTEPKYPVTIGERLVDYALNIVLHHEWQSEENEYIVEPLVNALNKLDTGVDQPNVWRDLFSANSRLKQSL